MRVKVTFQPEGKKIITLKGYTVIEIATKAGISIDAPCGALGKCGKCRVQILEGIQQPNDIEKEIFTEDEIKAGWRLACRTRINKDSVIFVPGISRLQTQKILDIGIEKSVPLNPSCRKKYAELYPASFENYLSDLDNLIFALGSSNNYTIDPFLLKELSIKIRDANWKFTAIMYQNEIIDIESGDTQFDPLYGVAFDIGTTTVVGTLVDLTTGETAGSSADMNSQVVYGDDVISRITFCITEADGTSQLNNLIIALINKLISEISVKAGIKQNQIYEMTLVGNTAMQHLLLGINPKELAVAPFVPSLGTTGISIKSRELCIEINQNGYVHILPVIAGWVGADTVGVILATNIYNSKNIKLAIDIGTNGELVLGNKDKLLVCSCAAGPAFEGAHILHGMRASQGAIERVDYINGDIKIKTIDNKEARGICGSGLIDAVALLLDIDILNETGIIKEPGELAGKVKSNILDRIKNGIHGNEFVFAINSEGKEISLTQRDIREVQLAKGAISAASKILIKDYGITKNEIKEILIAGAFGNYIRKEKALRIGLIPDIDLSRIIFTGNAAEEGARTALISKYIRENAKEIASKIIHVNLSGRLDFQDEFGNSMLFPIK